MMMMMMMMMIMIIIIIIIIISYLRLGLLICLCASISNKTFSISHLIIRATCPLCLIVLNFIGLKNLLNSSLTNYEATKFSNRE